MKKPHNWNRTGAIAGVISAIVAVLAFVPSARTLVFPSDHRVEFDGPIAQIAVHQKGWDIRGFEPNDMTSIADQVVYRFAGHYTDTAQGDHNPDNRMCSVTLHANPSSSFPYGGESGFVFIQTGTSKRSKGTVLHNPTLDEIYGKRLEYGEYVPPECWPGRPGLKYPHELSEYR